MWLRNALFLFVVAAGLAALGSSLSPGPKRPDVVAPAPGPRADGDIPVAVARIDAAFREQWRAAGLTPAPNAPDLAIARRLCLALVGTPASLEEIRRFEFAPAANGPGTADPKAAQAESALDRLVSDLLADRRHHDYLAERLARAYVGVRDGPFILYRRRRFVAWLTDELAANRPYDQIVTQLISDAGLWTDQPATNFITVTIKPDSEEGPNASELAARVSRAFLGIRIDCAECHDHPFQDWKREDFHGLAAFFGNTQQSFTGIRDGTGHYEILERDTLARKIIEPRVPFKAELLPNDDSLRRRLAKWVTHPDNRAFSLATANRVWALLFGRPLVEPIDDIPSAGQTPKVLEMLADDFMEHGYDLRRLIRVIASTEAFGLDSRSDLAQAKQHVNSAHEEVWASFPLTRLRPEQVVGAVLQAANLETIDYNSHILVRVARAIGQSEFVQRYGDDGEDEFSPQAGTIPQRLLMMNGDLVHSKSSQERFANAATRIASLARSDAKAVETVYLAVLNRRPTVAEAAYFEQKLADPSRGGRGEQLEDLYWVLINSTEFSWNH